ncbi:CLUMA_CG018594, isoform A [Clunio marinus]|uniref:CLUMA_CG018594, isoform A n=1 Tax=Clunio marinus TaxID=568069 RepID=A0A1J1IYU7_9DIPT|nr:CLUMA_CG018594, isoform A [Clunio marinus]
MISRLGPIGLIPFSPLMLRIQIQLDNFRKSVGGEIRLRDIKKYAFHSFSESLTDFWFLWLKRKWNALGQEKLILIVA